MYTKCPSCRAEISFQPPANAANLPDGYKYRVKCPSCGVTIGVKLPNRTAIAQVQPTFTPANPNALMPEPVYNAGVAQAAPTDEKEAKAAARAAQKAEKKPGTARNVTVLVFTLLLLVCSVLGYFVNQGKLDVELLNGLGMFDGVSILEEMTEALDVYTLIFEADVAQGMLTVLPVIFFLATLLTAALAIIGLFTKKYVRLLHLVLALGLLAVAACTMFQPLLMAGEFGGEALANYFMDIMEQKLFLMIVPVAICVIYAFCALILTFVPMKKEAARA